MGNVIIIGGGIAGLITSIQLARAGVTCTVIEKKSYPLQRVCGEYISNEARPFLISAGLYPHELDPPQINLLELSSVSGEKVRMSLDLGGFGVSRFSFDNFLYRNALDAGVDVRTHTEVSAIEFKDEQFNVVTSEKTFIGDLAIGTFGKRSRVDIQLDRNFVAKRSPFVGVKYHVRLDHPSNCVALHNFPGGYCGVSSVENGITNLCYLTHRDNLRRYGDIQEMETRILHRNPLLREIFTRAERISTKPEVINEISFATKSPVEQHILMAGDSAGMITPLCGNGMAIAIHSAKILSELVISWNAGQISREQLEEYYATAWRSNFKFRLSFGRRVQSLFGHAIMSSLLVGIARRSRPMSRYIVRRTHGKSF